MNVLVVFGGGPADGGACPGTRLPDSGSRARGVSDAMHRASPSPAGTRPRSSRPRWPSGTRRMASVPLRLLRHSEGDEGHGEAVRLAVGTMASPSDPEADRGSACGDALTAREGAPSRRWRPCRRSWPPAPPLRVCPRPSPPASALAVGCPLASAPAVGCTSASGRTPTHRPRRYSRGARDRERWGGRAARDTPGLHGCRRRRSTLCPPGTGAEESTGGPPRRR